MFSFWNRKANNRKQRKSIAQRRRDARIRQPRRMALRCEPLEDRTLLAYNLSIGVSPSSATENVGTLDYSFTRTSSSNNQTYTFSTSGTASDSADYTIAAGAGVSGLSYNTGTDSGTFTSTATVSHLIVTSAIPGELVASGARGGVEWFGWEDTLVRGKWRCSFDARCSRVG